MLVRGRFNAVAIVEDIQKAFLQVRRLLIGHDLVTFLYSFLSEMNRGSVCEIMTLRDN